MLQEITIEFIYHFMLIFARLGTAFSTFPALSDKTIMLRIRLSISLVITLTLFTMISPYLPKYSENLSHLLSYIIIEMLIGFIISIGAKFYFQSLHVVGQIISMQSGLGAATLFDPTQREQVAIFTGFLFLMTTTAILVTDTHYLFIQSIIESYKNFPPGELLLISDVSHYIIHVVNDTFILAFKLSSPFLVVSIVILVGSGILSRLMPNLQVFFVITPAQILVMFGSLYIVINYLLAKVIEAIQLTTNGISI